MSEYSQALGYCRKCGTPLIKQMGEESSMVLDCLICTAKRPCMKPSTVTVSDPGHEAIMGTIGVPVSESDGNVAVAPVIRKAVKSTGTIQQAIEILEGLPMPGSMQEFKKLRKVIETLKSLSGEQNAH